MEGERNVWQKYRGIWKKKHRQYMWMIIRTGTKTLRPSSNGRLSRKRRTTWTNSENQSLTNTQRLGKSCIRVFSKNMWLKLWRIKASTKNHSRKWRKHFLYVFLHKSNRNDRKVNAYLGCASYSRRYRVKPLLCTLCSFTFTQSFYQWEYMSEQGTKAFISSFLI